MNSKISVIIPVYNVDSYLNQTLDSVLSQTYNNLEVLCIDDGSTDSSLNILESYAQNDSRIKVLKQKHQGAGSARNLGLKMCTGKYVHFLDSDDWIKSDIYKDLIELIGNKNIDVCMFQYYKYDDQTGTVSTSSPLETSDEIEEKKIYTFTENKKFFLFNAVVPWNKLYLKDFLVKNNLLFDDLICANDRTFYYHMLLCNPRIILTFERYLYYRINNPNALTGKDRCKNFDCHFRSFERITELYKAEPLETRQMIIDISMRDFIGFYRNRYGEDKWIIYSKLHDYFQSLNVSILGNEIVNYSWYPEYKVILESPYFLGNKNPNFCINDREILELKKRIKQLQHERDKYKKGCSNLEKRLANIQTSWAYKIGNLLLVVPRKIKITVKYWRENGLLCTLDQICINLFNRNSESNGITYGITRIKRNQQLIVSLTSFPARIGTLHTGIISLLSQSEKPDQLILWLAESQFPNKEKDLPLELIRLKKYGLSIKWCEDIRSYKKLIPTLKLYPDAIIVTADDDNIYDRNWLSLMYREYQKNPLHIQCHRVTKFYFDKDEQRFKIITGGKDFYKQPNFMNKLVGLGGVLYPPHCFYKDILKQELFMELAPTSDDIWFWLMAALNNVRVNVVPNNIYKANYIKGTQEGPSLTHINDHGEKLFWVHFNNMLNHYPQLSQILKDDMCWK